MTERTDALPDFLQLDARLSAVRLARRSPWLVLGAVVGALVLPRAVSETWRATVRLSLQPKEWNLPADAPYRPDIPRIEAVLPAAKRPETLIEVVRRLGLETNERDLAARIRAQAEGPQVLVLTVSGPDAKECAAAADALADVLMEESRARNAAQLERTLAFYKGLREGLSRDIALRRTSLGGAEPVGGPPSKTDYFETVVELRSQKERLLSHAQTVAQVEELMRTNAGDFERLGPAKAESRVRDLPRRAAVAGAFLGMVLVGAFLALLELSRRTLQSRTDFEKVLGLPLAAAVPAVNGDDAPAATPLHLVVDHLHGVPGVFPRLIAVGSDRPGAGKSFLIERAARLLKSQGKKVLWIRSHPGLGTGRPLNRWLYGGEGRPQPQPGADGPDRALFELNEDVRGTFLSRTQAARRLKELSDYDYVFWELFPPDVNLQLYANAALACDAFLFVGRFGRSDRRKSKRILRLLRARGLHEAAGVLNAVPAVYHPGNA